MSAVLKIACGKCGPMNSTGRKVVEHFMTDNPSTPHAIGIRGKLTSRIKDDGGQIDGVGGTPQSEDLPPVRTGKTDITDEIPRNPPKITG